MIKNPSCGFTLRDLYNWDLDAVRFTTEKDASFDGKKRSIDVYGESPELLLVIENKVNARENYNGTGQGQTQDYYHYAEAVKRPGQKTLYFFITADQKQTSYASMYVQISYQELFDSIISKCIAHPQVSEDGKYLLEQYAANLRETVRGSNTPMALVNVSLCKSLYDRYAEVLDGVFQAVEAAEKCRSSQNPACMAYEHYRSIFDEIFLSVDERFGRTPKARLQRRSVNFTELYRRGAVTNGMGFRMVFDGEIYQARTILDESGQNCYFQLLNETGTPYRKGGQIVGIYENPFQAGVDVINLRREKQGVSGRVKTLPETACWANEAGLSVQDLMDRY